MKILNITTQLSIPFALIVAGTLTLGLFVATAPAGLGATSRR